VGQQAVDRKHIVFLKVAETGNLTAASRELRIAQPSLTRTVNKLEEEFGTPLFNRLPRGMELTEAGKTLLQHLSEMNVLFDRAKRDVEAVRKGYFETIKIGAGLTYQLLLMPRLLKLMMERFPNTSFSVSTGSAESHIQDLVDGHLDFVITAALDRFRDPRLDVRLLGVIQHGVVHRPGTLRDFPEDEPMPLHALADCNWILFQTDGEMKESLNQRFFRLGLPAPRVVLSTNSLQLGLDVMREQNLIMLAPTLLRSRLSQQGFLLNKTSEPLWQHDSGIAIHRANRGHPVLDILAELVEEFVSQSPEFEELK
jgi:DNA-binding transcriptional LysR family regulator